MTCCASACGGANRPVLLERFVCGVGNYQIDGFRRLILQPGDCVLGGQFKQTGTQHDLGDAAKGCVIL